MQTSDKKPDLFVVGAPKCGTTSLYAYLSQHDDVYMPGVKEPGFFSRDIAPSPYADLASYLALYQERSGQRRAGDCSPWHLYSPQAPGLIQEFSPQSRIVIMLRNPVDMIHSLHAQMCFNHGGEDIRDFEKALAAEPARASGRLPKGNQMAPIFYQYREAGRYAAHVKRWLEAYGEGRVHFILFEDLASDANGTFNALCRFLDIAPPSAMDFSRRNENKSHRLRIVERLLVEPGQGLKKLGRLALPRAGRERLVRFLLDWNTSKRRRRPLTPELRARLANEFAPDVRELEAAIGRDLSAWTEAPRP